MKTKMNFSYQYQITPVWILLVLTLLRYCVDNHAFYSGESIHFSELCPKVIYINTVLLTSVGLLWLASQLNKKKHILLVFIILWVLGTVSKTRRVALFCDVFVQTGGHFTSFFYQIESFCECLPSFLLLPFMWLFLALPADMRHLNPLTLLCFV